MEQDSNMGKRLFEILNTPDDKAAVRILCRELLMKFDFQNPPIPLKPICKQFNVIVKYKSMDNADAYLKIGNGGYEIEINSKRSWRRNRFTIAHEIVHLLIFNALNGGVVAKTSESYHELESLCDYGASEILIPRDAAEKLLQRNGLNSKSIRLFYNSFLISYDALFLWIANYFDATVSIWKRVARHQNEADEFRIVNHFPKYRDANKSFWLPNGCTMKHLQTTAFSSLQMESLIEDFTINRSGQFYDCAAFVVSLQETNVDAELPTFDHFKVPNEVSYDGSFVLFLFDKHSVSSNKKLKFLQNGE